MALAGVTAMLYGGHTTLAADMFLRKVDMRTVFFATVFIIVLLVLAYLTNPSEASFRAYLTEQSFRQHLSRLDESAADDQPDAKDGLHYTLSRRSPPIGHTPGRDFDPPSSFHFVNRASISLRTPKHVFHSFGILTVAAVFPNGPTKARGSAAVQIEAVTSTVNNSWFIGAFGKWWRGGTIRAWYHNTLMDIKDAERLSSGVLDVKALDSLEGFDGLTFNASTSLHLPSTDTTSKLRGTERPTQRTFREGAADAHAALVRDREAHRGRKRAEDAARAELKAQMKALEDAKRTAEGGRREVEKRLRAAESARDSASSRIERLGKEIGVLQGRIREDEQAVVCAKEEGERAEKEVKEELEAKRKEIKVAEDVVAALNSRAKELEELIAKEEERLQKAKEQAEIKKQDRSFYPPHMVSNIDEAELAPWSPPLAYSQVHGQDPHAQINTDYSASIEIFPSSVQVQPSSLGSDSMGSPRSSGLAVSPRPSTLSLGGISNFCEHVRPDDAFLRPQGFPYLDDNLPALSSAHSRSTGFSPFNDSDAEFPQSMAGGEAISPQSTSLIPSSLIKSLDGGPSTDNISRSFRSEDDDFMDANWRAHRPPPPPVEHPGPFTSSPTSITNPSFDGIDHEDPFEIRPPPPALRRRLTSDPIIAQRNIPGRTISDPQAVPQMTAPDADDRAPMAHRRWYSADPKEKKGLNPEAKVFRLTKKSLPSLFGQSSASFDSFSTASTASSLGVPVRGGGGGGGAPEGDALSAFSMRAFAPSPAEREVLQRALGSSTNASLERLPTLSEVALASMPASPSRGHAVAAQHQHAPAGAQTGARTLLPPGLSWLPRMRRPAFSPWDDEVQAGAGSRGR
ncbi:hypothetical protein WOLCODRAFT_134113 [Wolfiporia cocos MD-104 SS10]|uniref:Uncharacterized protein n=1 Tax=Wolfiporia cocos (strain MD-104) TaxID=742152 RepID=A0A2H3J297_WOLCO|nr:hypothetical protein WOLCODRAFT_134113 [Wolfiporia cocos MD-104 SS10]